MFFLPVVLYFIAKYAFYLFSICMYTYFLGRLVEKRSFLGKSNDWHNNNKKKTPARPQPASTNMIDNTERMVLGCIFMCARSVCVFFFVVFCFANERDFYAGKNTIASFFLGRQT